MTADWEAAVSDQNQALASFSFCQAQHGSRYSLDSKENMPALCLLIMGHRRDICFWLWDLRESACHWWKHSFCLAAMCEQKMTLQLHVFAHGNSKGNSKISLNFQAKFAFKYNGEETLGIILYRLFVLQERKGPENSDSLWIKGSCVDKHCTRHQGHGDE